jgi:hypothetical protein
MPTHGGTSDKFGNRYEFLWAVDQLLRILEGKAVDLTLEPVSPEESNDIEFKVTNADGTVNYWSVSPAAGQFTTIMHKLRIEICSKEAT